MSLFVLPPNACPWEGSPLFCFVLRGLSFLSPRCKAEWARWSSAGHRGRHWRTRAVTYRSVPGTILSPLDPCNNWGLTKQSVLSVSRPLRRAFLCCRGVSIRSVPFCMLHAVTNGLRVPRPTHPVPALPLVFLDRVRKSLTYLFSTAAADSPSDRRGPLSDHKRVFPDCRFFACGNMRTSRRLLCGFSACPLGA